jgi:hypothetical protein
LNPGSVGRIIDPQYRNPMTEEMNIGYTWQFTRASVVEAEYVHVLGLHENKTININPNLPIGGNPANGFARPLDAAFAAAGQTVLSSVRDEQSINRSRYDGMNLSYRQQMVRHLSLNANYTLAKAQAYGVGGGSFRNYPQDPRNPFSPFEYGPTPNDERHHITVSAIADLPWGIQFSPILQYGSARPYNLTSQGDTLGFGSGLQNRQVVIPNDSPGTLLTGTAGRTCYFAGTCHVAPVDSLRGNPFFQLDTRLTKNFKLGESRNLQIIAQAFNLTNRANYGNDFDGTVGSPTFGQPVGFVNPTSTNTPRSLAGEFGFRFTF